MPSRRPAPARHHIRHLCGCTRRRVEHRRRTQLSSPLTQSPTVSYPTSALTAVRCSASPSPLLRVAAAAGCGGESALSAAAGAASSRVRRRLPLRPAGGQRCSPPRLHSHAPLLSLTTLSPTSVVDGGVAADVGLPSLAAAQHRTAGRAADGIHSRLCRRCAARCAHDGGGEGREEGQRTHPSHPQPCSSTIDSATPALQLHTQPPPLYPQRTAARLHRRMRRPQHVPLPIAITPRTPPPPLNPLHLFLSPSLLTSAATVLPPLLSCVICWPVLLL